MCIRKKCDWLFVKESVVTAAMSTLAMVGGQPMVVTQTPMIVSLPQQAQIPVSIVTTGAMATTALSADLLSTQKLGLPALPALPHSNADPHSTTLLELAKVTNLPALCVLSSISYGGSTHILTHYISNGSMGCSICGALSFQTLHQAAKWAITIFMR